MGTTAIDSFLMGSKGRMEAILSPPSEQEWTNITISRNRAALGKLTNHLFLKNTTGGLYTPFATADLMSAVTNTTNSTVTVPNPTKFKVGDKCTFWDSSADAYYATEYKTISAINTSTGVITFTGVWTTPPTATEDYLIVADNANLSRDAVLVPEEIDFSLTSDYMCDAVFASRCRRDLVFGRTVASEALYDETKNFHLILVDE